MRGRGKFEAERIILLAHTTEGFARKKILRSAEHYLNPKREAKAPPSAVAAMMSRAERSGLAVTVRRIPASERKKYNAGSNARLP
jgi:hypothetical protein